MNFYNSKRKYPTRVNNKKTKAYQLWENIANRCKYLPKLSESKFGKYSEVIVCDDWLDYQNFYEWFNSVCSNGKYRDGWQLDKDLLGDGKLYSPETCCFLPEEINKTLNIQSRRFGELGEKGVRFMNGTTGNQYYSKITCKNKEFSKGKTFSNLNDAIEYRNQQKRKYINFLIEKYKENLDSNIVSALQALEVYDK